MNKMNYTAEEVRAVATAASNGDTRHPAMIADMLTAYADMIERAQKGVTDEVIDASISAALSISKGTDFWFPMTRRRLRAALFSVWPVAAERIEADESAVPLSRYIPCEFPGGDDERETEYIHGWNACRSDVIRRVFNHPPAQVDSGGNQLVPVAPSDASNYCRILSLLGMEEEGDPVAWVERMLAAAEPAVQGEMVRTAPARIYLQVSHDADDNNKPFPDEITDDLTWCIDSVMDCEVEYVRADLAAKPHAATPVPDVSNRHLAIAGVPSKYWDEARKAYELAAAPQPGESHEQHDAGIHADCLRRIAEHIAEDGFGGWAYICVRAADAIDAILAGMGEPVATILGSDPFDDDMRKGFYTSAASMERLASLPAGTKLYTAPPIDLAAVREVIAQWRIRADNMSAPGPNKRLRAKADGYRDCADELEAAIKGVA